METIELKNYLIPLHLEVEEYDYIYAIKVSMYVKDRDDANKEIRLTFSQSFFKEDWSKKDAVRYCLKHAVTHEIDECLFVDGQRVFDPHIDEYDHVSLNDRPLISDYVSI